MDGKNFFDLSFFASHISPGDVRRLEGGFKVKSMMCSRMTKFIYLAEDPNKQIFCVKLSMDQENNILIEHERDFLMRQTHLEHIPKLVSSGYIYGRAYIVMERLGVTLETLCYRFRSLFSITEAKFIAQKCFYALRELHTNQIIHGDIKPSNIITGLSYPIEAIRLIDFETAFHIQEEQGPFQGQTPEFCSLNQQVGGKISYADDLESLLYTLVFFYSLELPWNFVWIQDDAIRARKVLKVKQRTTIHQLCQNLPGKTIFMEMFSYKSRLKDGEMPDYNYLLSLVDQLPQDNEPRKIELRRDFGIHCYLETLYRTVEMKNKPEISERAKRFIREFKDRS